MRPLRIRLTRSGPSSFTQLTIDGTVLHQRTAGIRVTRIMPYVPDEYDDSHVVRAIIPALMRLSGVHELYINRNGVLMTIYHDPAVSKWQLRKHIRQATGGKSFLAKLGETLVPLKLERWLAR